MRRYRLNSPHAAARVVALTLLADGLVSRGELAALFRLSVFERLGIDCVDMEVLLEDLARDLRSLDTSAWDHTGDLHALAVRCVLDDVTDPELRQEVAEICREIALCESHLSDGEEAVLDLATSRWQLPAPPLQPKGTT